MPSVTSMGLADLDDHKLCLCSSSLPPMSWRGGRQVPTACRCVGRGPVLQMPREQLQACSSPAALHQL